MKITIIIQFNPFYQSSATANRWLTLIEGLNELNVQIRLLIYGSLKNPIELENLKNNNSAIGIECEYLDPIIIHGYFKTRYYNYIGNYFRGKKLVNQLLKRLSHETGIVWTDSSILSFRFAMKAKSVKQDTKLILEVSEFLDIFKFNNSNIFQRWQGKFKQRIFENYAFNSYDGIALMTKTLYYHFKSFNKPNIDLVHIPMTVDLDRFSGKHDYLNEFKHPYITFIGVMNDAKDGVSLLIKSFNLIKHKYNNYKLYLVGPWNYDTPNHLKLIEELELQNQVFWMKEYPRDEIPKIVCNADLLVLPRPDSKQAQGGFPTKLGEYLASGKPVCATRVGEIPDYLVDNESVFFSEPGSVESFAEAMDRALGDPQNAQRVGLNGRKVAEREFNKEIQAKKLYNFLKQLLYK